MKAQIRREVEAERIAADKARQSAEAASGPQLVVKDGSPMLSSVLFHCPDIGPALLPKAELEAHIKEFLLSQLAEEPEMTSALMILTLNKDREKVKVCIETLCKYIDNVLSKPDDEKFRKIRIQNKVFQSRVAHLEGTDEFLQAAGFHLRQLPFEDREETFYVLGEDEAQDTERLKMLKEVLLTAEPLKPELYRDLKIFHPASQATASKFIVPDEFYTLTPEEIKREQQLRQEAADKFGMLRTKAMRERDELKELRKYRYALIRVRLPDGIMLQGTFRSNDKFQLVINFVRECLVNDWMPFILSTSTGQRLTEEDLTLAQLGLAPAALINFCWDADVLKEVSAQKGSSQANATIKPELHSKLQSL